MVKSYRSSFDSLVLDSLIFFFCHNLKPAMRRKRRKTTAATGVIMLTTMVERSAGVGDGVKGGLPDKEKSRRILFQVLTKEANRIYDIYDVTFYKKVKEYIADSRF